MRLEWLSQRHMAELFDTCSDNISFHLKHIFYEEELLQDTGYSGTDHVLYARTALKEATDV